MGPLGTTLSESMAMFLVDLIIIWPSSVWLICFTLMLAMLIFSVYLHVIARSAVRGAKVLWTGVTLRLNQPRISSATLQRDLQKRITQNSEIGIESSHACPESRASARTRCRLLQRR